MEENSNQGKNQVRDSTGISPLVLFLLHTKSRDKFCEKCEMQHLIKDRDFQILKRLKLNLFVVNMKKSETFQSLKDDNRSEALRNGRKLD